MKWNSEKGFATYQSAMNNIRVLLGVRNLGLTGREVSEISVSGFSAISKGS